MVRRILFDSPPASGSCFSERLLVGSHPKTRDTGKMKDSISIGVHLLQKQNTAMFS